MVNFKYVLNSGNVIPKALFTVTSADAVYGIANISVLPVSKPYRTVEGGIASQKIRFDFGTPQTINAIALVNHNFTSAAVITLRAGNSPDPDGSTFNVAIPWAQRTAWAFLAASQTYRFWSVTIDDPTNSYGFLQIGYLLCATVATLPMNFQPTYRVTRTGRGRVSDTDTGVPMVGNKISDYTSINVSWDGLSAADRATLELLLAPIKFGNVPFLFAPVPTETEAYFGRLKGDYGIDRNNSAYESVTALEFSEDAIGMILAASGLFNYEA
jgi:hypothetical protein